MMNDELTTGGSVIKDRTNRADCVWHCRDSFGCVLSAHGALMILGMVASVALNKGSASSVSAGTMIPGLLFYVLLAAWFIWMGIGSIQADDGPERSCLLPRGSGSSAG